MNKKDLLFLPKTKNFLESIFFIIKAILNKPLLGYGVENLQETFVSYYDASWAIHGDVNQVPDRAHNIVLDILMSGGILLLLAYIFE